MTYAAQSDIISLYGDRALYVADRDGSGTADSAAVDAALALASGEIDSFLAVRYDLPLPDVPGILVQLCVDITLYRLALSWDVLSDEHRRRYEDAIAHLGRIAKGAAALVLPSAPPLTDAEGNPVTGAQPIVQAGPPRLFSRDQMRGL